ncbi:MAG: threonine synthase [Bacteroidota bacterium]
MQFYSLTNTSHKTTFKDAVIAGIAPDKGLYFPEAIRPLPTTFFSEIGAFSNHEIALKAIEQFVEADIPTKKLEEVIANTLDFDFPLVNLEGNSATLELFHGPTMAFKDVGARFMANCLGYFSEGSNEKVTVLVATSGDTGGAVANGFFGVEGVNVVILYPRGKVSDIQEKQLTTLGQNITALEVEGTFDDCQRMVKRAFLDKEITHNQKLTSANSINIARWLPQLFYYLFAFKQAKDIGGDLVFSVPSGNFGNICAGMVAYRLGMPVKQFVASTNINDVVPNFMKNGQYQPKASSSTISNAMDVGDPSNFIRIQKLFDDDFAKLSKILASYAFSDDETKAIMRSTYERTGYVLDPHGAVGYLGLHKFLNDHPDCFGIFLETAHPIKFLPVIKATLGIDLPLPPQIQKVVNREKVAIQISNYADLKNFLIKNT